ncbi:hypothetical protein AB0I94_31810 [Streptomyces sp. NPDC050147]|uniref:hypothetical protein n=1 Tax=Streptomyces sp. NPDC050147 TaxID=3155513 RepID=UPI003424562A
MTTADFRPTHVVPQDGLSAWEAPDVNRPTTPLDALLPVQLADRLGDWARIVCANDWSAWVDGRLLIAVPKDPPAAGHPLTRTGDPGPLLARTEEALSRYRRASEELAAGETNGESFRDRTHGLRVGVVVDGESMWLYDAEHERWVYCEGTRLNTYAAGEAPSVHGAAGEAAGLEPPRAVGPVSPNQAGGPDGDDSTGRVPPVSDGAPVSGGGVGSGGAAGPEPTQVVEAAGGSGRASVRGGESGAGRVSAGERAVGPGGVAGPESTQVVEAAGGSGRASVRDGESGAGRGSAGERAVRPGGAAGSPEPTQVVEALSGAGPVRAADSERGEGLAPDPAAEEPTRRIPPVTVDPGPAVRSGDA